MSGALASGYQNGHYYLFPDEIWAIRLAEKIRAAHLDAGPICALLGQDLEKIPVSRIILAYPRLVFMIRECDQEKGPYGGEHEIWWAFWNAYYASSMRLGATAQGAGGVTLEMEAVA